MKKTFRNMTNGEKYRRLRKWNRRMSTKDHLCRLHMGWIGVGELYYEDSGRGVCRDCFKRLEKEVVIK